MWLEWGDNFFLSESKGDSISFVQRIFPDVSDFGKIKLNQMCCFNSNEYNTNIHLQVHRYNLMN